MRVPSETLLPSRKVSPTAIRLATRGRATHPAGANTLRFGRALGSNQEEKPPHLNGYRPVGVTRVWLSGELIPQEVKHPKQLSLLFSRYFTQKRQMSTIGKTYQG